ncbi:hypothetical protein [uncultured Mucilaginibacter sp.]|uniref:hypothetical protein n=1 Tax=uncultured Mucilaginibacter sp. TaxID=797541 RepID=UPI0025DDB4E4|nr:hypothetical protein [uncultured Mucilaginibacter sp.]
METFKNSSSGKFLLLFVTTTYLFIAISHIFFLPHYNVDNTTRPVVSNSIFKRHTSGKNQQETSQLRRTDKSTLDEKKKLISNITVLVTIAFLLVSIFGLYNTLTTPLFPRKYLFINRQYSYLSLCTFRI